MSTRADLPIMVMSCSQLWLWAQEPCPPAVRTFCSLEAANQKNVGLEEGGRSLF